MIKLYTCCLVVFIGNLIVGQSVDFIKTVKYDSCYCIDFYIRKIDDVIVAVMQTAPFFETSDHNVTILEANPDRYGGKMWTTYDILSKGKGIYFYRLSALVLSMCC